MEHRSFVMITLNICLFFLIFFQYSIALAFDIHKLLVYKVPQYNRVSGFFSHPGLSNFSQACMGGGGSHLV